MGSWSKEWGSLSKDPERLHRRIRRKMRMYLSKEHFVSQIQIREEKKGLIDKLGVPAVGLIDLGLRLQAADVEREGITSVKENKLYCLRLMKMTGLHWHRRRDAQQRQQQQQQCDVEESMRCVAKR
ncbi:hypothetical protein VTL71DRAFT_932 [Oculimacula yallundae]|uniref:Uncharacterized protein n=1 Tax=Oculimacula yallundae TaxID=86028 RepID=A0ABR4D1N0_9HELO